jgi:predicted SAM-dependent methyltransferase
MRLHIGGWEAKQGWKILNDQAREGVDFIGDIRDLSRFADASCEEVYASHVLEHVPLPEVLAALSGVHRILEAGGRTMIAVPDLELLAQLLIGPELGAADKFQVIRIMFGGQLDASDYHCSGFTQEILAGILLQAGFARVEPVESFGLFADSSEQRRFGVAISLNVIAYK